MTHDNLYDSPMSSFTDDEIIDYLQSVRGYEYAELERFRPKDMSTNELIDEMDQRGFTVVDRKVTYPVGGIVQMHRCGDPRWEQLAIDLLYEMANKVI